MSECKHCFGSGVAPDWVRLGRILRDRRVSIDAPLREVARRCGISAAHLSAMEKGERSMGGPGARRVLEMFELCPENAFLQPTDGWPDALLPQRREEFHNA